MEQEIDIIDILRDWHRDAVSKNDDEARFIKQIIDEMASLRYQSQNPGLNLTVGDWKIIDKMMSYAQHKKSCAISYGRCTCRFEEVSETYARVRRAGEIQSSEI